MYRAVAASAQQACLASLLSASLILPSAAAALTLRIESNPSGAEVLLIGGSAGRTPITVNERAIYPNDYPGDRAQLYGTVTLRYAGCKTLVHRITGSDLERGLQVTLDCGTQPAASVVAIQPEPSPALSPAAPAALDAPSSVPTISETISQRRLRQLQVLQEMLDENLITPAEEQRIRRKLLQTPQPL